MKNPSSMKGEVVIIKENILLHKGHINGKLGYINSNVKLSLYNIYLMLV